MCVEVACVIEHVTEGKKFKDDNIENTPVRVFGVDTVLEGTMKYR